MARESQHNESTKREALEALKGSTAKEVAAKFKVSIPTLYNWRRALAGEPRARKAKSKGAQVLPLVPQAEAPKQLTEAPPKNGVTIHASLADAVRALEEENARLRARLAKAAEAFSDVG